jgi:hypothetical protein
VGSIGHLSLQRPVSPVYAETMAEPAPDYSDLHRLIDRMNPDQVRALRAVALQLVPDPTPDLPGPPESNEPLDRRLSFVGAGHGGPDLASSSQEILRAELGESSA